MECMTTSKPTYVIIFLYGINADSARIAWGCEKLRGKSIMNVVFIVFFVFIGVRGSSGINLC
jgi:hypothetical protein